MPGTESNGTEFLSEACGRSVRGSLAGVSLPDYRGDFWSWGRTGRARCGGTIHACDPLRTTKGRLRLGSSLHFHCGAVNDVNCRPHLRSEHIIMTSDTMKPVARQRKPRTRYEMLFDYNKKGNQGYLLENLLSLAPDEKALRPPPGRRGFRDYPEMPRFLFDKSVGRLPQDLELFHAYWLVSDRTKSVFEAVDPAGFAFLACDVRLPRGDYDGSPYWLCDVVRVLDALDEAQSRLTIGIRESKAYSDFGKKYYSFSGGRELVFRDDAIGDARVFRMEYLQAVVICDQTMKRACKAAGLKGIKFDGAKDQFLASYL
jgi:Protein of unknown function (DUF1629)